MNVWNPGWNHVKCSELEREERERIKAAQQLGVCLSCLGRKCVACCGSGWSLGSHSSGRVMDFSRETLDAFFVLAGIEIKNVWELPNGYNPERYKSPWWLVETKWGLIKIGRRKRVVNIDWSHTKLSVIVTEDDVTKDEFCVHAWTTAKVIEYLSDFRKHADMEENKWVLSQE